MVKTIAMPTRQLAGENSFVGGVYSTHMMLLLLHCLYEVGWYCGGRHGSLCGVRVLCEGRKCFCVGVS